MNRGIATLPKRSGWRSPLLLIAAAGLHQFAHGMGTDLAYAHWLLFCLTAEGGYEQGDWLPLPVIANAQGSSSHGAAVVLRGGRVLIAFASVGNVFRALNPTSGAEALLTNANWQAMLVLRAID